MSIPPPPPRAVMQIWFSCPACLHEAFTEPEVDRYECAGCGRRYRVALVLAAPVPS